MANSNGKCARGFRHALYTDQQFESHIIQRCEICHGAFWKARPDTDVERQDATKQAEQMWLNEAGH